MSTRLDAQTPMADAMRAFVRLQVHEKGWSAARIAHEMNELGHIGWTVPVVTGVARVDRGRAITIDEYVALCAIFKRSATEDLREVDRLVSMLNGKGKGRA